MLPNKSNLVGEFDIADMSQDPELNCVKNLSTYAEILRCLAANILIEMFTCADFY